MSVEAESPIVVEIPIKFLDQEELSILRDVNVVHHCPVIIRAVQGENPEWATAGVKLRFTLEVQMNKAAGDFIFTNTLRYKLPEAADETPNLENFTVINEKTLVELKEIIEAASFLENIQFMDCVAFVIAKKLDKVTVEEAAALFGVPCQQEAHFFDENDGWIHAPNGVFQG